MERTLQYCQGRERHFGTGRSKRGVIPREVGRWQAIKKAAGRVSVI